MSTRIISATITAGNTKTIYPTSGDLQYTKPVSAQYLPKSGEIVIFEEGNPVDTFLADSFFVPDPGKRGMWWKGRYKGNPATLCITSLTDGGEKVHGQPGSIETVKLFVPRR